MSVNMEVKVGSVHLDNPILTAAGTNGFGSEFACSPHLSQIGAAVSKSLTLNPSEGNKPPTWQPVDGGYINNVGVKNPGVDVWVEEVLPKYQKAEIKVVASIFGTTFEEYCKVAEKLADVDVLAVEVNFSCPNVNMSEIDGSAWDIFNVMSHVSKVSEKSCWAKFGYDKKEALLHLVDAAMEGGAEAVTLINTIPAMHIEAHSKYPMLGGLSGQALHPIAVRAIYDVHTDFPDVPIVGVGGVSSGITAAEMLLAGASAVQVGSVVHESYTAPTDILMSLEKLCSEIWDVSNVSDLIGDFTNL